MNDNVEKILKLFIDRQVLSILESPNNYIVSICDNNDNPDDVIEALFAVDKKSFKVSEFSYFMKPDEYAEACNHVLYKHGDAASDELTHWGIPGMRWGVRRYQNKDGSLTKAGRKRYDAELEKVKKEEKILKTRKATQAKIDKLTARRKALEDEKKELDGGKKGKKGSVSEASGKKSIKDMTDDELARAVNRSRLEEQYRMLNPEPPVKQSFLKRTINDVVIPAATNSGRKLAEGAMDRVAQNLLKGKGDPNSIDALKKTYEKLDLQKKIEKLKKGQDDDMSPEDRNKMTRLKWDAEDRAARSRGYQNWADETHQRNQAAAAESARKANDAKSREYYESSYNNKGVGEKTQTGIRKIFGLPSPSAPVKSLSPSTVSSGKSTADKYMNQNSYELIDRSGKVILGWDDD